MSYDIPLVSYNLEAVYNWISDNGGIPNLGIDIEKLKIHQGSLPPELYTKTKVLINIGDDYIEDLIIAQDGIAFSCDLFERDVYIDNSVFNFYIPIESVVCILDPKNGLGIDIKLDDVEFSQESSDIADSIIDMLSINNIK